jgi:hypothetical protein
MCAEEPSRRASRSKEVPVSESTEPLRDTGTEEVPTEYANRSARFLASTSDLRGAGSTSPEVGAVVGFRSTGRGLLGALNMRDTEA